MAKRELVKELIDIAFLSMVYFNLVKTSEEAPPPPHQSADTVSDEVDPVSDRIHPRQVSSYLQKERTDEQSADRVFNDNRVKTPDEVPPPPPPSADSISDPSTLIRPRQVSSCLHYGQDEQSADRVFIIDIFYNRVKASDEPPPSPSADSVSVIVAVSGPSTPTNTSSTAEANSGDQVNPVIKAMQEKELGKTIIALPVNIVIGVGVAGYFKLGDGWVVWLILTQSCLGFIFIFHGMLMQNMYPRYAPIAELLGILLVATSVFSVMALFLPLGLIWVPVLGIVLCVLTFAIAGS